MAVNEGLLHFNGIMLSRLSPEKSTETADKQNGFSSFVRPINPPPKTKCLVFEVSEKKEVEKMSYDIITFSEL